MKRITNFFSAAKKMFRRILRQLAEGEQAEITVEFRGKKIVQTHRIIKNGL
jgi:hypothetical protein